MGLFSRRVKQQPPNIYRILHAPYYIENPSEGIEYDQSPDDDASLRRTIELITIWCNYNRFMSPGVGFQPTSEVEDKSKMPDLIFNLNWRSLTRTATLSGVIKTLHDTEDDRVMNRIFALHVELLTMIDPVFLTKMVNRLYAGLEMTSVTPGPEDRDEDFITWPEIHTSFPYLWVIWLIQFVMHNESTPVP